MFNIKPYLASRLPDWELVLESAVNGTFMHARSFMEYHRDRFQDASLLLYKKDKPVGIFPANREGDQIHSHQGLTYGGLILSSSLSMEDILFFFREVLRYYAIRGISVIHIKEVPSFYGKSSLEWASYCMFILGATPHRTELTFAIPLPVPQRHYSKGRRWGINRARKNGLMIREVTDFRPFWQEVLCPNLWEKHQVRPVHTLEEIQSLANNNAPFIRQFEVLEKEKIIAGTTIFDTPTTAHTQYISATNRGKALSALDLLMDYLVQKIFSHKVYFDFGTVNESQGRFINKGLMEWKESFGAQPYVHQFYSIDPKNYHLIDGVFRK
ncbi:MAG: hypothetical protein WD426_01080 [Anditalea sp.]